MATALTESVPYLSREDIERRAAEVRREHHLEAIPIDPLVLAHRLGMDVRNARFYDDRTAGMLWRRGDQVTLLVNRSSPPLRKRFTIAHELGHYFLHLSGDGEFVDGTVNLFRGVEGDQQGATPERRREIQANLFAAALLMPEPAVRAAWQAFGSVETLAREFQVSQAAMGIRIDQLGLG